MKGSRFRVGSAMALIALAALDLGLMRVLIDHRTQRGDLLMVGAMPMANVLAAFMLIGRRRLRSRPFLLGFGAFGAIALASYLLLATLCPRVLWAWVFPWVKSVASPFGRHGAAVGIAAMCSSAAVILGLPQVAFALFGGLLFRRFRTTGLPSG